MHDTAMHFVRDALRSYEMERGWDPSQLLVEFGAYDVNGSIRGLFAPQSISYFGVDLQPGPHVDLVKDAALVTRADLGGRSADIVVTTNVFEHVEDWPSIVKSAFELLHDGGWFIVQCAGPGFGAHSGKIESPHLEPDEWYRNVPAEELRDVMSLTGFTDVRTHWREEWPQDTTGIGKK